MRGKFTVLMNLLSLMDHAAGPMAQSRELEGVGVGADEALAPLAGVPQRPLRGSLELPRKKKRRWKKKRRKESDMRL